jgi:hypothetical protein
MASEASPASKDAFEPHPLLNYCDMEQAPWWLTFRDATTEADFLRYRVRHRRFVLLVILAFLAVFHAASFVLTRQSTHPEATAALVMHAASLVVCAAAAAATGALMRCAAPMTVAHEVTVAKRIVWIGLAAVGSQSVGLCATASLRTAIACDGFAGDARCELQAAGRAGMQLIVTAVILRPSIAAAAVLNATLVGAFFVGAAVHGAIGPVDCVLSAIALAAAMFVAVADVSDVERRERRSFAELVAMWRADNQLRRLADDTAAVLAVALPTPLLRRDPSAETSSCASIMRGGHVSRMSHQSGDASVGVCDVSDFAQWCCGVLVGEIVMVLHTLLLAYDIAAETFGVIRAMTYGDACVVCAGLMTDCKDHPERVLRFCGWIVANASDLVTGPAIRVRAAVCSGPLIGGIVGAAAARYVVTGPALVAAEAALPSAAEGTVSVASAQACAELRRADDVARDDEEPSVTTSAPALHLDFSRWTLRFADAGVEHARTAAADSQPTVRMAAIPLVVYSAFLLIVLLELAAVTDDHRRSHTRPLPLAGLCACVAALAVVLGLRVRRQVAARKDTTASLAELLVGVGAWLVGSVSLAFVGCAIANPGRLFVALVAVPLLLPSWPFLAQLAAQGGAVLLPSFVWLFVLDEYPEAPVAFLVLRFVAVVCLVRYTTVLTACQHHAAGVASRALVAQATERSAIMAGLLAGLVPAHAVLDARDNIANVQDGIPGTDAARAHTAQWHGLSVLQVALHSNGPFVNFERVAEALRRVGVALDALTGTSLESVEATADTFLLAGPFYRSMDQKLLDGYRTSAARHVAAFASSLQRELAGHCDFTAVATSGSGHGALLGARNLTFRLIGPVVRESNALLAAAPRVDGRCVAFATESFRRQHSNFEVPKAALATGADGRMSVALPAASQRDDVRKHFRDVDDTFHAVLLWRVRGVGVTTVSALKLAAVPTRHLDAERSSEGTSAGVTTCSQQESLPPSNRT